MSTPDWTLYVKTRCPWCVEAVAYLRDHGYEYREVDVIRDADAYEKMKKLSGQRLTPTLVIESTGQISPDFDMGQLEGFLQEKRLAEESGLNRAVIG